MNFLDPKDVEAWLAELRDIRRPAEEKRVDLEWVLEQFVRALAAGKHYEEDWPCARHVAVARLLVKVMDGGER